MTTEKKAPNVNKDTAKGFGEGGHSPHPNKPEKPAPFDPHSYANLDTPGARKQERETKPIPSQSSTDPEGTGHETTKGGLPEKQPTTKQQ